MKFSTLYAGYIDMEDLGEHGAKVGERWFSNEQLATVYDKSLVLAQACEELGFDTLWLAEHHFQPEGYEVIPNLLMLALYLAGHTKRIEFGCGFNITTMWHPLRLAEDYAMADILTKWRVLFGIGRGYHTREVETFGVPMMDQETNREIFEEQLEIIFKALQEEKFSHQGKHYTIPPHVPYRNYMLEEISVVPRPMHLFECWQPIVSGNPRGLEFMAKHGIKGIVGNALPEMVEERWQQFKAAYTKQGVDLKPGERFGVIIPSYLADTQEQGIKEFRPVYQEYQKFFGPFGFIGKLTDEQLKALDTKGGWKAAGVRTLEEAIAIGSHYVGHPDGLTDKIKGIKEKYPYLEHIFFGFTMSVSQSVMLQQLTRFSEEVMPAFKSVQVPA